MVLCETKQHNALKALEQRNKKTEKGQKCDSCQHILKSIMIKTINSIAHQQEGNYNTAVKISLSSTLTAYYEFFIEKFRKTFSTDTSKAEQLLRSYLVSSLFLQ